MTCQVFHPDGGALSPINLIQRGLQTKNPRWLREEVAWLGVILKYFTTPLFTIGSVKSRSTTCEVLPTKLFVLNNDRVDFVILPLIVLYFVSMLCNFNHYLFFILIVVLLSIWGLNNKRESSSSIGLILTFNDKHVFHHCPLRTTSHNILPIF